VACAMRSVKTLLYDVGHSLQINLNEAIKAKSGK
jgi:hypothetical protein